MTRGIYRCVICDRVSNSELAEFPEDLSVGTYRDDGYHSDGYRCSDCQESIWELMNDYYLDDEYGDDERVLDEE